MPFVSVSYRVFLMMCDRSSGHGASVAPEPLLVVGVRSGGLSSLVQPLGVPPQNEGGEPDHAILDGRTMALNELLAGRFEWSLGPIHWAPASGQAGDALQLPDGRFI